MDLFLSWSGPRSKVVAVALRDWIPCVLQAVKPWMSEEDIGKGARGLDEIAQQLEKARAGIICLTPENLGSTWIAFEAGALSKKVGKPCVIPYLLGIEKSELTGPLAQFQCAGTDRDDTWRLMIRLNEELGDRALSQESLAETLGVWWPKIENALKAVPQSETKPARRSEREMIEEVLEIVRSINYQAHDDAIKAMEAALAEKEEEFRHLQMQYVSLREKYYDHLDRIKAESRDSGTR